MSLHLSFTAILFVLSLRLLLGLCGAGVYVGRKRWVLFRSWVTKFNAIAVVESDGFELCGVRVVVESEGSGLISFLEFLCWLRCEWD